MSWLSVSQLNSASRIYCSTSALMRVKSMDRCHCPVHSPALFDQFHHYALSSECDLEFKTKQMINFLNQIFNQMSFLLSLLFSLSLLECFSFSWWLYWFDCPFVGLFTTCGWGDDFLPFNCWELWVFLLLLWLPTGGDVIGFVGRDMEVIEDE